jgi:hypothetical protein
MERNPPCPDDLLATPVLVLVHNICTIVLACGELFNCLRFCCLGSTARSPQNAYGAEVVIASESARMRTEVPIFTSAAVAWCSSCRGHGCALEELQRKLQHTTVRLLPSPWDLGSKVVSPGTTFAAGRNCATTMDVIQ